jgi:hypothetical protein
LEHQVLHLPSDKQDATLALNSLYGSLENIVLHVREASFATFTSKRRLDKIRWADGSYTPTSHSHGCHRHPGDNMVMCIHGTGKT